MKKLLALALALMMTFMMVTPAFAAEEKVPSIYIYGRHADIYTAEGKKVYPNSIQTDFLMEKVKDCLPALGKGLVTNKYDEWVNKVADIFNELYSDMLPDENGDIVNGSYAQDQTMIVTENPKINTNFVWAGYNYNYGFKYDWRVDVFEVASYLDRAIKEVKERHHADKVNIVCRCYGCNLVLSYLSEYGSDDINTCVFLDSLALGSTQVGTLFSGKIDFTGQDLQDWLNNNYSIDIEDEVLKTFLNVTLDYINSFNGIDKSTKGIVKLVNKLFGIAAQAIQLSSFGRIGCHWNMVDDSNYEDAKKLIFAGKEDEYKNFIAKIDRYHYDVMLKSEDIINSCVDNGMKVAVLAKYNLPLAPFTEGNPQADGSVEVALQTFGCTAAEYGKVLGAGYLLKADKKYVSSDKIIDSSTAPFKDVTWYYKNLNHQQFDECNDLIKFIFDNNGEINVFSDERYPQYLCYNSDGTITPLKDGPSGIDPDENPTIIAKCKRQIKAVVNLIVFIAKFLKTKLSEALFQG